MADREIERVRTFAKVMDNYFVDPLVGLLLPGAGDVASSVLGLYTVGIALRRKMSPVIIARMLLNLAFDAALGVIPFIGDILRPHRPGEHEERRAPRDSQRARRAGDRPGLGHGRARRPAVRDGGRRIRVRRLPRDRGAGARVLTSVVALPRACRPVAARVRRL
jgi:hypothetical protein